MNTSLQSWLNELGLGQYAATLAEQDIDLEILPDLTDQDLKDLGVSLGHRKRLLAAIEKVSRKSLGTMLLLGVVPCRRSNRSVCLRGQREMASDGIIQAARGLPTRPYSCRDDRRLPGLHPALQSHT